MGAAVLCGAISTFLAVAVLLNSKSYVFDILSKQFALTVVLGVSHGLILLPVMLSLFGPKPFATAESIGDDDAATKKVPASSDDMESSEQKAVPVPPAAEEDIAEEANEEPSELPPSVPQPKSFDTTAEISV